MTQPVSCGARWPCADFTCTESSREESETLTCEEPRGVSCPMERAQRIATPEPRGELAPGDGSSFCARADTVLEGFLCNDRLAVSNACRKPTNAFDEFICDDPRMQRLQWAILRETWAFVKAIALALVRRP